MNSVKRHIVNKLYQQMDDLVGKLSSDDMNCYLNMRFPNIPFETFVKRTMSEKIIRNDDQYRE